MGASKIIISVYLMVFSNGQYTEWDFFFFFFGGGGWGLLKFKILLLVCLPFLL